MTSSHTGCSRFAPQRNPLPLPEANTACYFRSAMHSTPPELCCIPFRSPVPLLIASGRGPRPPSRHYATRTSRRAVRLAATFAAVVLRNLRVPSLPSAGAACTFRSLKRREALARGAAKGRGFGGVAYSDEEIFQTRLCLGTVNGQPLHPCPGIIQTETRLGSRVTSMSESSRRDPGLCVCVCVCGLRYTTYPNPTH